MDCIPPCNGVVTGQAEGVYRSMQWGMQVMVYILECNGAGMGGGFVKRVYACYCILVLVIILQISMHATHTHS